MGVPIRNARSLFGVDKKTPRMCILDADFKEQDMSAMLILRTEVPGTTYTRRCISFRLKQLSSTAVSGLNKRDINSPHEST